MRCRGRLETGRTRAEHSCAAGEGLYDLSLEKILARRFIANIKGKKSHQIVSDALNILCNLEHRGAVAPIRAPATAPASWCRSRTPSSRQDRALGFTLPQPRYRSARCSCRGRRRGAKSSPASSRPDQGRATDAARWRDVQPTIPRSRNRQADRACHMQMSSAAARISRATRSSSAGSTSFASRFRKQFISARPRLAALSVSMSCRTVVYKACFLADQLPNTIPT